jgi:hypothetical protein
MGGFNQTGLRAGGARERALDMPKQLAFH